jgi:error-prone DNA polymerase
MRAKGIAVEFAERVFEQIRGFGEYGFPESHAASFALIAYATAWMRKHHPDVFACSLLNAQPMGFYAPATIIEDAKRHGVVVLPVDATISDWECEMESGAVRLGLRYVKGLHEATAKRLLEARAERPFASIEDLVLRAKLDEGSIARLAEAGALAAFQPNRRGALWAAKGAARLARAAVEAEEPEASFRDLDDFESIGWDFRTMHLSARAHPLVPLRRQLAAKRLPDAETVRALSDGSRTHYAGLVICRQRPGTASGVVFLTLEDETGFVNVVIWTKVYERYRVLVKTASFLGVSGKLQVQDGVTHLIAESFWRPKIERAPADVASRDFH